MSNNKKGKNMVQEKQPFAEAGMLIRKPVELVLLAFINPEITTKFWFSKSTGRLDENDEVLWTWEMYNHTVPVFITSIIPNEKIIVQWGNYDEKTTIEWTFIPLDNSRTFVNIVNSGFKGTPDELMEKVRDSTGGFTLVLAGLKAYLEHNIQLNLIVDRFPKELGGH
ncbi:MAG: SRPBCC family protein [Methanobacterium sp.]